MRFRSRGGVSLWLSRSSRRYELLTGIRQKSARQWSGVGRVVVSIVGVVSLFVWMRRMEKEDGGENCGRWLISLRGMVNMISAVVKNAVV